jgi:hypothetical protein
VLRKLAPILSLVLMAGPAAARDRDDSLGGLRGVGLPAAAGAGALAVRDLGHLRVAAPPR